MSGRILFQISIFHDLGTSRNEVAKILALKHTIGKKGKISNLLQNLIVGIVSLDEDKGCDEIGIRTSSLVYQFVYLGAYIRVIVYFLWSIAPRDVGNIISISMEVSYLAISFLDYRIGVRVYIPVKKMS